VEIRCVCGQVYHADPAHAGRQIRCRCGRTIRILKPGGTRRRFRLPRLSLPRFRLPRWWASALAIIVWLYLAGALASALLLWGLSDRWWPATVLLYGPRWFLLLPAAPLALAALVTRPRLLLPLGLALLTVLGPVMGLRTGWRGYLSGPVEGDTIRLVTFNVEGAGNERTANAPEALAALGADIMAFQECSSELVAAARRLDGWSVRRDRGLCLVSRFPLAETLLMEEIRTGEMGTTGAVARYHVALPAGRLTLGNLHLETPRRGLERLRGSGEAARLVGNTMLREAGSRRASRWLEAQQVEVVAGDFNLPVESRIYRENWTRCGNAFSRIGRGFGWTRILYRFSARIDHVLVCRGWHAIRAEVGPDLGSDHLPVIVDLVRRP
jgi:vancomycin resistance protein VanJ